MSITLHEGDCLDVMARLKAEGVRFDSCVTDPPYHLTSIVQRFGKSGSAPAQHGTDGLYARASAGFMGKAWDGGDIAFRPETWRLVFDLLKPGAYLVAFSGTRTYHRMACAIEDAGFVVRDQLAWMYGTGFPKSHDIGKAIDKAKGAKRPVVGVTRKSVASMGPGEGNFSDDGYIWKSEFERTAAGSSEAAEWEGWGTALKPAWEPIVLAQKPVDGTIAANVLRHGTGAINIDACRVEIAGDAKAASDAARKITRHQRSTDDGYGFNVGGDSENISVIDSRGRWPANILHDGSDEIVALFPTEAGAGGRASGPSLRNGNVSVARGKFNGLAEGIEPAFHSNSGSAARFFYSPKADQQDRWGSKHPTVKPVGLIRWLERLITPPGGLILEPFAGSGTAGVAAIAEGFHAHLIEREPEYIADIRERIAFYEGDGRHSLASKNRNAAPSKAGENPLIDWLQSQAEAAE